MFADRVRQGRKQRGPDVRPRVAERQTLKVHSSRTFSQGLRARGAVHSIARHAGHRVSAIAVIRGLAELEVCKASNYPATPLFHAVYSLCASCVIYPLKLPHRMKTAE